MSLKGPRCLKHPSHPLVGVCAFCLTERLSHLSNTECPADSTTGRHSFSSSAVALAQRFNVSSTDKAKLAQADSRVPSLAPAGNNINGSLEISFGRHSFSSAAAAAALALQRRNLTAIHNGKLAQVDSTVPSLVPVESNNISGSAEISYGRHSLSSGQHNFSSLAAAATMAQRPSLSSNGNPKLAQLDPRMPSLAPVESSINGPVEIKLILCDNTRIGQNKAKSTTKMPPVEHVKLAPVETKVASSSSYDSHRSSFSSLIGGGARGSHPASESRTEMAKSTEDDTQKKMTLSSLFTLADGGAKVRPDEMKNPQSTIGSSSASQNSVQYKLKSCYDHRRLKNDSFSERVEQGSYLFPVPEATKSSSWFASLFRRLKKSQWPKSVAATATLSEHPRGWQHARQSWDAPRPSAWEQLRFSSFEGHRSSWEPLRRSWEPSRPSWDGVMRTSDTDSVLNGIDFATEGPTCMRGDADPEHRSFHDRGGDWGSGIADGRKISESKLTGSKSMSAVSKTPQSDDKDKGRTFQSSKSMQTQRDVSTQTTPPRASDAAEMFIQQRLDRRSRQCSRASNALWSKVWTKTFSNSKWAFKNKQQRGRGSKEHGDAASNIDESHDPCSMTSGRSPCQELPAVDNPQYITHPAQYSNTMEHDTWDAYYGRVEKRDSDVVMINNSKVVPQQKISACKIDMMRDDNEDKSRNSSLTLDTGVLRFYLTPGRRRQAIQGTVVT